MERIDGQMPDLREVFSNYVHPDFLGGTSIKDALPIMVPELSYEGMDIRDGATASERWWAMTAGGHCRSRADRHCCLAAGLLWARQLCDVRDLAEGRKR